MHRSLLSSFALFLSAHLAACGGVTEATMGGPPGEPAPSPAADDDVLAFFMLDGVHLVTHDGSQRVALAWDPLLAGVTDGSVMVNGGYVFLTALADGAAEPEREALITADGRVLWKTTLATSPTPAQQPLLGEDGSVVRPTDAGATVVRPDGTSVALTGFVPLGAPTADGFLAVGAPLATLQAQDFELTAASYGWWKIGGGSPITLAFDPVQSPSIVGRTLVYAPAAGPATRVVLQTPEEVRTLDLPGPTDGLFGPGLGGTRWLAMADPTTDAVWRIDLAQGTSERIPLAGPEGFTAFPRCGTVSKLAEVTSIMPDGRLLASLRTPDRAAFFVSSDGSHWTQIGETATSIGSLDAHVVGSTFAVLASQEVPCYTPGPTWTAPTAPALLPQATQLVRPADSASFVREGDAATALFAAALSWTGRYAAFWDPSSAGSALEVVDIVTGTDHVVLADVMGPVSPLQWVGPRPGAP